jgi:tRNA pseudouridine55 synthase
VRSLAHDLGQILGCGAHLTDLTRQASGQFQQENSVSLEAFAQAAAAGSWPDLLHSIDTALVHFPALHLDVAAARRICSGQPLSAPLTPPAMSEEEQLARVYGPDNAFLALARYDSKVGVWRPHKVFYTPEP